MLKISNVQMAQTGFILQLFKARFLWKYIHFSVNALIFRSFFVFISKLVNFIFV